MFLLPRKIPNLYAPLVLLLVSSAAAQSPPTVGELFASETTVHGPALLAGAGMNVVSGSQVAAGRSVATLRLERGGEVRLCPNAGLTISATQGFAPQSRQELMLAMDTGSLELDYPINDLADTLITPDFKLTLAGPGVFHFALGVNNQGDTCIKPMRGNSASIIVSEMLGNDFYQVRPDQAILFAGGKLSGRTPLIGECGCPEPPPVMVAEEKKAAPSETAPAPAPASEVATAKPAPAKSDPTAPLPPENPDAVHVEVEVPLIYRGDQPIQPAYTVAHINFSALPNVDLPQEKVEANVLKTDKEEVSAKGKQKKGFFGKIKGFFASLFHK